MRPILDNVTNPTQDTIIRFGGIDKRTASGNNVFRDGNNIVTDEYPYVAVRELRGGLIYAMNRFNGMTTLGNDRYIVWGTNLYCNDLEHIVVTGLADTQKHLVCFGSYILIFPDGKYYNTADGESGSMSIDVDFNKYRLYYVDEYDKEIRTQYSTQAPTDADTAKTGDRWLVDDGGEPPYDMYVYDDSKTSDKWTILPTGEGHVFRLRITSIDNHEAFKDIARGDRITMSGYSYEALNGTFDVASVGYTNSISFITVEFNSPMVNTNGFTVNERITLHDYNLSVLFGGAPSSGTGSGSGSGGSESGGTGEGGSGNAPLVPDYDFGNETDAFGNIMKPVQPYELMFESGNRLWTCIYKQVNGKIVNEIRASALGDFRHWTTFDGTSLDSYAVSIGIPGEWTGACEYQGHPTFMKEDAIIRVYGSYPAQYQTSRTVASGAAHRCHKSLCEIDGYLYYLSNTSVMAYSGAMPSPVSQPVNADFVEAHPYSCAGRYLSKYYLDTYEHIYVYDTKKRTWVIEDPEIEQPNQEYVAPRAWTHGYLVYDKNGVYTYDGWIIDGVDKRESYTEPSRLAETEVEWFFETGDLLKESQSASRVPRKKYVSNVQIRAGVPYDANIRISIMYDNSGVWETARELAGTGNTSKLYSFRPRRCDSMRLRFEGRNHMKLYSITLTESEGSDV